MKSSAVVLSPAPSYEFRESPEKADWSFDMKVRGNSAGNCLNVAELIARTLAAFFRAARDRDR